MRLSHVNDKGYPNNIIIVDLPNELDIFLNFLSRNHAPQTILMFTFKVCLNILLSLSLVISS